LAPIPTATIRTVPNLRAGLTPQAQITGLRDSWPLASWSTMPAFPRSSTDLSTANPMRNAKLYRMPSASSSAPYHVGPQPTYSRSGKFDRNSTGNEPQSSHSAQSSVSSSRASPTYRRSISDNHLTSILRSTSQRLREARRRPMSRALSVLSQASGNPPPRKAPSPPKTINGIAAKGDGR